MRNRQVRPRRRTASNLHQQAVSWRRLMRGHNECGADTAERSPDCVNRAIASALGFTLKLRPQRRSQTPISSYCPTEDKEHKHFAAKSLNSVCKLESFLKFATSSATRFSVVALAAFAPACVTSTSLRAEYVQPAAELVL